MIELVRKPQPGCLGGSLGTKTHAHNRSFLLTSQVICSSERKSWTLWKKIFVSTFLLNSQLYFKMRTWLYRLSTAVVGAAFMIHRIRKGCLPPAKVPIRRRNLIRTFVGRTTSCIYLFFFKWRYAYANTSPTDPFFSWDSTCTRKVQFIQSSIFKPISRALESVIYWTRQLLLCLPSLLSSLFCSVAFMSQYTRKWYLPTAKAQISQRNFNRVFVGQRASFYLSIFEMTAHVHHTLRILFS